MISAIFIPYTPEMLAAEFMVSVSKHQRDGLKLYLQNTGERAALLDRQIKGWTLFSEANKCEL